MCFYSFRVYYCTRPQGKFTKFTHLVSVLSSITAPSRGSLSTERLFPSSPHGSKLSPAASGSLASYPCTALVIRSSFNGSKKTQLRLVGGDLLARPSV